MIRRIAAAVALLATAALFLTAFYGAALTVGAR